MSGGFGGCVRGAAGRADGIGLLCGLLVGVGENAAGAGQLAEIAQELADVVYVAYGTALAYGVDLDAVVGEVHRANMTKLGLDGHPVVRNGKVVKGPGFRPPDVAAVIGQVRD